MRKISFIMAALALVLGVTQCKKENKPVASGETQRIVLTASNGNDGSKVAVDAVSGQLNLTWEGDDEITVSGAVEGTLSLTGGAGEGTATFEGSVTRKEGDKVTFSLGANPTSFEGQIGNEQWIHDHPYFKSNEVDYNPDGVYGQNEKVPMQLQYAVLKLDLSAFGTEAGTKVTISNASGTVATVTDVKTTVKEYYVAMPLSNEAKEYTFSGNGIEVVLGPWTLAANTFYTNASGEAIVIEPATPTTPKFTVGMDGDKPITVEFAPGNLWYGTEDDAKPEAKAFHFEDNQWETTPTSDDQWNSSHVSHFKWSDAANAVTGNTNYNGDLFCASNFTVDGDSHTWRTLSIDEWGYLLGKADPSRADATFLCAWKSLDDGAHKGLVILPDGTKNPSTVMGSITSTSDLATYGAVFLPAAGYRYETRVVNAGSSGVYWSSTPDEDDEGYAFRMGFGSDYVGVGTEVRYLGLAVRLVRDVN